MQDSQTATKLSEIGSTGRREPLESRKLIEIMTSSMVTVDMDYSLTVVKDIFDHTNFHHLLVV